MIREANEARWLRNSKASLRLLSALYRRSFVLFTLFLIYPIVLYSSVYLLHCILLPSHFIFPICFIILDLVALTLTQLVLPVDQLLSTMI
jgi:hypothetical protein